MKVYLNNGKYFMDDNGNVVALTPNDDRYLKLPANSVNRTWVSCAKIDKAPNQCIDYGSDVKVARTLGPRTTDGTTKTVTKGWTTYLTDEEKVVYEELKAKAERRAKIEALKTQMAADQARLAELEAQA